MIRSALALIAGMMCVVAGLRQAQALKAADASLKRWTEITRHLALLLHEGAYTLPEAFLQAASGDDAADKLLRSLAQRMTQEPLLSPPDLWQEMSGNQEPPLLTRMMQRLSHGSLESRQQAVQHAADELALLSAQAREKSLKDEKMWRTLGLLGGACVTIMLL